MQKPLSNILVHFKVSEKAVDKEMSENDEAEMSDLIYQKSKNK